MINFCRPSVWMSSTHSPNFESEPAGAFGSVSNTKSLDFLPTISETKKKNTTNNKSFLIACRSCEVDFRVTSLAGLSLPLFPFLFVTVCWAWVHMHTIISCDVQIMTCFAKKKVRYQWFGFVSLCVRERESFNKFTNCLNWGVSKPTCHLLITGNERFTFKTSARAHTHTHSTQKVHTHYTIGLNKIYSYIVIISSANDCRKYCTLYTHTHTHTHYRYIYAHKLHTAHLV